MDYKVKPGELRCNTHNRCMPSFLPGSEEAVIDARSQDWHDAGNIAIGQVFVILGRMYIDAFGGKFIEILTSNGVKVFVSAREIFTLNYTDVVS